jgi:hypothetical protein
MSKNQTDSSRTTPDANDIELREALDANYVLHDDALLGEGEDYTRTHFVVTLATNAKGVHMRRVTFPDPKLADPGETAEKADRADELIDIGMAVSMMRKHIESASRFAIDHYQLMKFVIDNVERLDKTVAAEVYGGGKPTGVSLSVVLLKHIMDEAKDFDTPGPFARVADQISSELNNGNLPDFKDTALRLTLALREAMPEGAVKMIDLSSEDADEARRQFIERNAPAGAVEKMEDA